MISEPKTGGQDLTPDLAVVGAGPAGLGAAIAARAAGLTVVLLDDQRRPGGQGLRQGIGAPANPFFARDIHHVLADPAVAGVDYRPNSLVWGFDEEGLHVEGPEGRYRISAKRTVLATGASEWVLPIPGWTLPGVVTAGGAQALLKASGVAVGRRIAIAGTGPLLLQLATQLLSAGARLAGIFEVAFFGEWLKTASYTMAYPPAGVQGLLLCGDLWRRGINVQWGLVPTRIVGRDRVEGLEVSPISPRSGCTRRIEADAVCLSFGLTPAYELASMRGCRLAYDPAAGTWQVERDEAMRSSLGDVFVAGDGVGIGGARYAILEGQLAGCAAAQDLGALDTAEAERRKRTIRRRMNRLAPLKRFLARTYRYRPGLIAGLPLDAILCRCEQVKVGTVRAAIRDGIVSPHELRILTRVGMGPCQGRFCSVTAERVLALETGRSPEDLGISTSRPPVRPLAIGPEEEGLREDAI